MQLTHPLVAEGPPAEERERRARLIPDEGGDLGPRLGPLTDLRVVRQSAPFDHPQLFVPNGVRMQGSCPRVTAEGVADEVFLEIPAVGRAGGPLPAGFLE
jgi:hypothetical protein